MPAYSRILLPWDSQPQEVVEVAPDLALTALITPVMSRGVEMRSVIGPAWVSNDTVRMSRAVAQFGQAIQQTAGYSGHWSRVNPNTDGPLTIGFIFSATAAFGNPVGMWQIGSTGSGVGRIIINSNTGSLRVYVGAAYVIDVAGVFQQGKTYSVVASFSSVAASTACVVNVAVNGVVYTGSGTNNANAATNEYYGIAFSSVTASAYGEFWSTPQALGAQVGEISKNQWPYIYAPRSIPVPVSAGGGTSFTITPSGGLTFGGTSVDVKGKILTISGGITFSGTGSATFASGGTTYTITPTGGLVFAGSGVSVNSKVFLPSGGITFAGSGLDLRTKVIDIGGGVSFGGTGSMSSNTSTGPVQSGERTKVGVGT